MDTFTVVVTVTNVSDAALRETGEKLAAELEAAGLDVLRQETFPPGPEGQIAVALWLARDPRIVLAQPATREVA